MTDGTTLLPCPKCGREVKGYVCGCAGAFGCGEYEYEIDCQCGILWNSNGCCDTPEEAECEGIREWNRRYTEDDLK